MSNDPLYPFGYGLSYTKFSYSPVTLASKNISTTQPVHIKLTVTNSGNYDGEETVQIYIRDMVATVTQPVKELKKFQKVYLKKGESKEISFTLTTNDLKFVNSDLKWVYESGRFQSICGWQFEGCRRGGFDGEISQKLKAESLKLLFRSPLILKTLN